MTSPALSDIDGIVQDLAAGDIDEPMAMALVRRAGGQATAELLADAVRCWGDVCDFTHDGSGRDPRAFLEVDRGVTDEEARTEALRVAQDEYDWALHSLLRPAVAARRAS